MTDEPHEYSVADPPESVEVQGWLAHPGEGRLFVHDGDGEYTEVGLPHIAGWVRDVREEPRVPVMDGVVASVEFDCSAIGSSLRLAGESAESVGAALNELVRLLNDREQVRRRQRRGERRAGARASQLAPPAPVWKPVDRPLVEPNACRYCGHPERGHLQRTTESAGLHSWTEPTDRQRLKRMRQRRARRLGV